MPGAEGKDFRLTDSERCSSIGFDVVQDETAVVADPHGPLGRWAPIQRWSIRSVWTAKTSGWPTAGIEFQYVNIDHGGNIEVLKRPDGKTDQENSSHDLGCAGRSIRRALGLSGSAPRG